MRQEDLEKYGIKLDMRGTNELLSKQGLESSKFYDKAGNFYDKAEKRRIKDKFDSREGFGPIELDSSNINQIVNEEYNDLSLDELYQQLNLNQNDFKQLKDIQQDQQRFEDVEMSKDIEDVNKRIKDIQSYINRRGTGQTPQQLVNRMSELINLTESDGVNDEELDKITKEYGILFKELQEFQRKSAYSMDRGNALEDYGDKMNELSETPETLEDLREKQRREERKSEKLKPFNPEELQQLNYYFSRSRDMKLTIDEREAARLIHQDLKTHYFEQNQEEILKEQLKPIDGEDEMFQEDLRKLKLKNVGPGSFDGLVNSYLGPELAAKPQAVQMFEFGVLDAYDKQDYMRDSVQNSIFNPKSTLTAKSKINVYGSKTQKFKTDPVLNGFFNPFNKYKSIYYPEMNLVVKGKDREHFHKNRNYNGVPMDSGIFIKYDPLNI
jgi:hypothetical protein